MTDRLRQLFSYGTSIVLHLLLVVTLAPCIPTVPGLIRVQRISQDVQPRPEAVEPRLADSRDPAGARPAEASEAARDLDPDGSPDLDPTSPSARQRPEPEPVVPTRDPIHTEPQPEPESMLPEPPELQPLDEAVTVVHTEAPGERPDQADAESLHDRRAEAPRHAPVTSDVEGPETPQSPESQAERVARGVEDHPRAASSEAPSAPRGQAGPPESGQARGAVSPASDGVPQAPDAPDWWAPIATRVPPGQAEPARASDPDPDGDAEDPESVPDAQTEVPKATGEQLTDSSRPDPSEVEPHPLPPAEPAPDRAEVPESIDGVTDAQVDGEVQDGEAPNLPVVARTASSVQMVVDGPEGETAEVSAIATERGAWIQSVDVAVRERWTDQELPVHLQGIGVRGDVTVRFTIQPNGRTGDVRLIRKSGNEWLDALAISAIPPKVPRMPRTLEPSAVEHDITFRYR